MLRAAAAVFLFAAWLGAAPGLAQDPFVGFETDPLQPADTSSPRDTLRSFDDNITQAMRAWREGATLQEIVGPGRRALETIDFSELPGQGRFAKEVETALLLKEILDRIKLPPEEEIPDEAAVDDKENPISRWSIPQTRITIARSDHGARAGEFLFTAATVKRLADYYEATRHLPYKAGALAGIYDEYTHSSGLILPRSWIGHLPAWSKRIVFGQAVWQWLGWPPSPAPPLQPFGRCCAVGGVGTSGTPRRRPAPALACLRRSLQASPSSTWPGCSSFSSSASSAKPGRRFRR